MSREAAAPSFHSADNKEKLVQLGGLRGAQVAARLPGAVTGLRTQQIHAPASSYEQPSLDQLSEEWFEGRRQLDQLTRRRLDAVAPACVEAPAAQVAADGSLYIPPGQPLPFIAELSVRYVEERHLWIGVQIGTALVLDDAEHQMLSRLASGLCPAEVVTAIAAERAVAREEAWQAVGALVSRLVEVGFLRGVQDLLEQRNVDPRRFLRIHLTQKCNLACAHCYADSSPLADTHGQLSPERWMELITDFAASGGEQVLFTGGEALLYKGCDRLLRHSKAAGLYVTLFSNGALVERHIEAIRAACDIVQISIDGADAESNDPIRGAGSFERAVRAIDALVAAGVPTRVSTVLMQQNFEAIRDGFDTFAHRWEGRDVDFRLGNGLTTHGRGKDIEDNLEHERARAVIDRIEGRWGKYSQPETFRRTTTCGYCEQVVVGQDGNVHPCHLLDGAITHIDDAPFPELLARLRRTGEEYNVDQTLGCHLCDIRYLCGGECRVENGKKTGNRRITSCQAEDKLRRLRNLVRGFGE